MKVASKILGRTVFGITDLVELDVRKPHVDGKASLTFISFGAVVPEGNWAAAGNYAKDCFLALKFQVIKAGHPHLFSFHIHNEYNTVQFDVFTRDLKNGGNLNSQTNTVPNGPFVLSYVFTPPAAGAYEIYLSPVSSLSFHFYKVEISVVQ